MRGSGGTEGGVGLFVGGLALSCAGIYFFFDSVRVTTEAGFLSGAIARGISAGSGASTTSMGILFIPFLLGVAALFYNSKQTWAWITLHLGLAAIAIEVLSRLRFYLDTKLSHLLGMMALFAAGVGLILRSFRDFQISEAEASDEEASQNGRGNKRQARDN